MGPHPRSFLVGRAAAWIQLVGIVATVLTWFVVEHLGLKVPVLVGFLFLWGAWFVWRAAVDPSLWRHWGFVSATWRQDADWYAVVFAGGLAVVATIGWLLGNLRAPGVLWLVLVLYPAWAVAQQFTLQNAVVDSLRVLGMPRYALPFCGAFAFAFAHAPDLPLMALTAVGGFAWTWFFLQRRNLWLLAVVHAVVGTLAFVWVLGRDPLAEFPQLAGLFVR